jgi:hypothetical protein
MQNHFEIRKPEQRSGNKELDVGQSKFGGEKVAKK